MEDKIKLSMPKNKTGIYASEIRSMVVPNHESLSNNMNTISLTNQYPEMIGYRQHSAFKIRVKPRQALATVNTKLMEQYPRPSTKTSIPVDNINIEDDYDTMLNNYQKELNSTQADPNTVNKLAFRPSTVRKRNKTAIEEKKNFNAQTGSRTLSSKPHLVNPDENLKLNKSSSPALVLKDSDFKLNRNKTDASSLPKTKNTVNLNYKSEVQFKIDLDYEDQLKDESESGSNTPHTKTDVISSLSAKNNSNKPTSELFREIFENLHRPNSNIRSHNTSGMKSACSKANTLMDFYANKYSLDPPNIKNANSSLDLSDKDLLIQNLSESQFVELLKEYRKTKSINFNNVKDDKKMSENENLYKKSTNIVNLEGEFVRFPSNQTFNSMSKSMNNNLFGVNSSKMISASPSFNQNSNLNNTCNNSSYNKAPEYFVNYLNNKLLGKNSNEKGLVGILTNTKSTSSNLEYLNELKHPKNFDDNRLNKQNYNLHHHQQQQLNQQSNSDQNSQKFHIKVLNFPTVAN